jgi:hypothetical protein
MGKDGRLWQSIGGHGAGPWASRVGSWMPRRRPSAGCTRRTRRASDRVTPAGDGARASRRPTPTRTDLERPGSRATLLECWGSLSPRVSTSPGCCTSGASSRCCSSRLSSPGRAHRQGLPIQNRTTAGATARGGRPLHLNPRGAGSLCPTPNRHGCGSATIAGSETAFQPASEGPHGARTADRCGPPLGTRTATGGRCRPHVAHLGSMPILACLVDVLESRFDHLKPCTDLIELGGDRIARGALDAPARALDER